MTQGMSGLGTHPNNNCGESKRDGQTHIEGELSCGCEGVWKES